MNGFVVWDNKEEKFIADLECSKYNETFLNESSVFVSRFSFFQNIGKKDINGKDIVADSSIVEFNLSTRQGELTFRGHYSFCESSLGYIIKPFDDSFLKKFGVLAFGNVWFNEINNIRIIDTIQENKLGLVK